MERKASLRKVAERFLSHTLGAVTRFGAYGLYAIVIAVVIQAWVSGSLIRWPAALILVGYGGLTAFLWTRVSFSFKAGLSGIVLLALMVLSAWQVGSAGALGGLTVPGVSRSALAMFVTAAALAVATYLLATVPGLAHAGRLTAVAAGVYCILPFVMGLFAQQPFTSVRSSSMIVPWLPVWLGSAFIGIYVLLPLGIIVALYRLVRAVGAPAGRVRQWGFIGTSLTLSLLLALPNAPDRGRVSTRDTNPSMQRLVALRDPKNLPAAFDLLELSQTRTPRAPFDVESRAAKLGADVETIFAFVRDQVRYEAYEGVLRGPRGTLMAMAGNSFDKSLLLGALLQRHGIEVRYARGRLSEERASALIQHMLRAVKPLSSGPTPPPGSGIPGNVESPQATFMNVVIHRWISNLDLVRSVFHQNRVLTAQSPPVPPRVLIQEAVDHVWVEYRRDQAWVPLDPSFTDARAGDTMTETAERWEVVPESLFHKVGVRVMVEERAAGKVTTREALRYEGTAADLNGAQVSFEHQVASSPAGTAARPVLRIDDKTFTGKMVMGSGLLRRIFGRPGEPPGKGRDELTAEWIEFAFTYPSGRTETLTRELFDRIGPAARAANQQGTAPLSPLSEARGVPLPLAAIYAFSFSSGRFHPGLTVATIARHLPLLRGSRQGMPAFQTGRTLTDDEATQLAEGLAPILPDMLSVLALTFHIQSQRALGLSRPPGVWFYETTPRLAIVSATPAVKSADKRSIPISLVMDLRRNSMRTVAEAASPREVIWANASRGILDGALEHTMFGDLVPPISLQTDPASTVAIMERARRSGTALKALRTPDSIQQLEASDDIKARMRTAFSDSVALVVPVRPVLIGERPRLGWWQVDLQSGETLAVMDTGLHQTGPEWKFMTTAGKIETVVDTTQLVAFVSMVIVFFVLSVLFVPLYYMLLDILHGENAARTGCPNCSGNLPDPPPGCYWTNDGDGQHVVCN